MDRRLRVAAVGWALAILAARAMGLVREAALGRLLGLGAEADAYQAAFLLPDVLSYLLAGGAIGLVLIPLLTAHAARGEPARASEALAAVLGCMTVAAVLLVALFWALAPALARAIAPGFDAAALAELTRLTRIVLPAQVCHLVGGVLGAALQARERHAPSALAPLLYTGCVIAGGAAGGQAAGADGFAWGVVAGSALGPLGLPLLACWRAGLLPRPTVRFGHPDVRRYLAAALPIMLGVSIVAVDDWIIRREASRLGEGAIAALAYAKALMRVPLGVFGLAAGLAAFPTLSRLAAAGQHDEASRLLHAALRRVLLLAFAAQAALTAAGPEIARAVYGARATGAAGGGAIALGLAAFALGLGAWAAQGLLSRAFYAQGRTWAPTVLGSAVAVAAYPLYPLLAARLGAVGLALASALAMTAYALALAVVLARAPGEAARPPYAGFLARAAAAVALGVGAGLAIRGALAPLPWLVRGAASGAGALAAFGAVLLALGEPLARGAWAAARRRSRRGPVVECEPRSMTRGGAARGERPGPEGRAQRHHEEGAGRGDRRRLHDRGEPQELRDRGEAPA